MYSLVLMTAMASSPTPASFNGYFRDRFVNNGCSGTSASASCNGCSCNGGYFSGDRMKSFFSFGGSCNGCSGTSNSCSGCTGTVMSAGCCGGVVYSGCTGTFDLGTPYATPIPTAYYGGCVGNGMPTVPTIQDGNPMIPPTALPGGGSPYAQPAPADVREYTPKNQLPLPGGIAASPNRATVIVKLPADARLFAEGTQLNLTSGERSFLTPELPLGREYNYTFRIEYDRNGRTLGESRTIPVTPGKVSTLEFVETASKNEPMPKNMESKPATTTSLPKAELQGSRASIKVKVPAGSTLFVNDVKQSSNEFRTPPLPTGKEFTYTMKIETTRGGMAEQASQKVTFRAGDSLTVDFTGGPNLQAVSR